MAYSPVDGRTSLDITMMGWFCDCSGISTVEKATLRESLRHAFDNHTDRKHVYCQAVRRHRTLSPQQKEEMIGSILLSQDRGVGDLYHTLFRSCACTPFLQLTQGDEVSEESLSFRELQSMAIAVFSCSRKVSRLSLERKRALSLQIHATTCKDELRFLLLETLIVAQSLHGEVEKQNIANDVFDGEFYNLLLEDRFDCEIPTNEGGTTGSAAKNGNHHGEEEAEECPVCLGDNPVDRTLACSHRFCSGCVTSLVQASPTNVTFPCPMCRSPSHG